MANRDFLNSLNSSLNAGAMMQGIYLRGKKRQQDNLEREAGEYMRGIDQFIKEGGDNPADWSDDLQQRYVDFSQGYSRFFEHSGNTIRPEKLHRVNGKNGPGVAMEVTSIKPDGSQSRGPLTNKGTSDDDDEVSVVSSATQQLKNPIAAMVRDSVFKARSKSKAADDWYRDRQDERVPGQTAETLLAREDRLTSGGAESTAEGTLAPPAPVTPASGAVTQAAELTQDKAPIAASDSPAKAAGKFTPRADTPFKTPGAVGAIRSEAEAIGLDPELAMATSYHESKYGDTNARSHTGAQGLFQIVDAGATEDVNKAYGTNYTVEQAKNDEATNIAVGTRYLKLKLDEFDGDREKALMAYNSGASAVRRADAGGAPVRKEGLDYPGHVLQYLTGSGDAGAAEAPAASPETEAPSTPDEAPRTRPRGRQGARIGTKARRESVTAENAEIAAIRATRKKGNRASTRRENKRIAQEVRAVKEKYAEQRNPTPEPVSEEERFTVDVADFAPQNSTQEQLKKEAAETANEPPPTKEQIEADKALLSKKKPAEKWTREERQALYDLNRVAPNQFPVEQMFKMLGIGPKMRAKASDIKVIQTKLGQVVYNAGEDTFKRVPQTAQEQALATATVTEKAVTAKEKVRKAGIDRGAGGADRAVDQLSSMYTFDGAENADRKEELRADIVATANNMNINMDAKETPRLVKRADKIQKLFNEAQSPSLLKFWTWFNDTPYSKDFSAGIAMQAATDNPHRIDSDEDDTTLDAAEWVNDNYFKPIQGQYPELDPRQVATAVKVAGDLRDRFDGKMSRKAALQVAGKMASMPRNRNKGPAELLSELAARFNANQAKKNAR